MYPRSKSSTARQANLEICELLFSHGANLLATDHEVISAWQSTSDIAASEVLKILGIFDTKHIIPQWQVQIWPA